MNVHPAIPIFLLGCCLPASLSAAVTLGAYARSNVVTVYTVSANAEIPLAPEDQTNNYKAGDKVLTLSGKHLDSLDGIGKLRVMDQGHAISIRDVQNLHLYLNDNSLSSLPPEFFELQNVKFVYVYNNQFDDIPPQIAKMQNLQGMYFTANRLTRIQPAVFTMTWLRKLQVSKNRITELPAAIGNLTELIHFNVSDNRIAVLPDSISRLTNLRVCDFSDNPITRLPEAFGKVRIMHQLRICNDPIETLPAGFAGMPGSIDITGTKIDIESLPPALRANIGREKRRTEPKVELVKRKP